MRTGHPLQHTRRTAEWRRGIAIARDESSPSGDGNFAAIARSQEHEVVRCTGVAWVDRGEERWTVLNRSGTFAAAVHRARPALVGCSQHAGVCLRPKPAPSVERSIRCEVIWYDFTVDDKHQSISTHPSACFGTIFNLTCNASHDHRCDGPTLCRSYSARPCLLRAAIPRQTKTD